MTEHVDGPLYYERMGRAGPPVAFIHPNPMDQSCWIYQMAHLSTWCRCISIDIPGYGRSPTASTGLTMNDMADACWAAIDDAKLDGKVILVGCSIGSGIIGYMHHRRPDRTAALVMSGAGYSPDKEFAPRRIGQYAERGIGFRWDHTFEDLSPMFRTTQLAHYFAELFTERNATSDVQTIIRQFEAGGKPDPDDHHSRISCPTIILTGSEDGSHKRSFALQKRIPNAELRVLPGAGHACMLEQPWLFDKFLLEFLRRHKLLPAAK